MPALRILPALMLLFVVLVEPLGNPLSSFALRARTPG
jgi:hypothetical protein